MGEECESRELKKLNISNNFNESNKSTIKQKLLLTKQKGFCIILNVIIEYINL